MLTSFKYITIAILLTLSSFSICYAQSLELPQSADLLSVTMIPSIPKPFDRVTIDLQSFMTDLNKAMISWSSGEITKKGRGEKHFEFTVGDVGSVTVVNINIQTSEGTTVTRSISVRPGNIDLLWEASTYTPPFYKGKALFTPQAEIKVVAMPNLIDGAGTKLESKDLIYKWKINGKLQESSSGFGKNYIYTTGTSVMKTLTIEVEASSLSGNTKAKGSVSLNETTPSVLFYEDSPILGIFYEKALPSKIILSGKEVILAAAPYFFSTDKKDSGLSYSWLLNDNPVTENESSITLRMDKEIKGTASVGIEVKSLSKLFQFTRNSLLIDFGENVR